MTPRACDVVIVRSTGVISRLIQFFTRKWGEPPSQATHVGIIAAGYGKDDAYIIEAIHHVVVRKLSEAYSDLDIQIAIYRPTNLTPEQIGVIVDRAFTHVGEKYGYLKIIAHALDWIFNGSYVFRRLIFLPNYPICSYLVADAFRAAGLDFGVKVGAASPDDIHDFVIHSGKYECIKPLGGL